MIRGNLRAVLFDWDGTLVDTADASFRCYVRMFETFGIPFDRQRYAETYSPDWHHTYRSVGLPEHRWDDADRVWLEFFATEEQAPLIEGAIDALRLLGERGVTMGIVTSGGRARIIRELDVHEVAQHFVHVVCGDDGPRRKPHPDALQHALEQLRVAPPEAAYVGDSPEDVMMAKAAEVFSVAIPGRYPNTDALVAAGPDLLARDLRDAVERILSSRA